MTLAIHLARGWNLYPVARGHFVEVFPPAPGTFGYERRPQYRICALVAIYVSLTGVHPHEMLAIGFDGARWGIFSRTGIDLGDIYAPAVAASEHIAPGQPVALLNHLITLTDLGWPKQEIIGYCDFAEKRHFRQLGIAPPTRLMLD